MKTRILSSVKEDLKEGYSFYELQREGVGSYFLEAISADIIVYFQKDSPSQYITALKTTLSKFMPYLIAEEIPHG